MSAITRKARAVAEAWHRFAGRNKFGPPSPEQLLCNVERFSLEYRVALLAVTLATSYSISWRAVLPIVSLGLILSYLHVRNARGVNRTVAGLVALPHCFFLGFLGGKLLILTVVTALCGVVAHAACRKASRKARGERNREDIELGTFPPVAIVQERASSGDLTALEEFRRHSQSVKQKYGL